jgi:hypothetical protein
MQYCDVYFLAIFSRAARSASDKIIANGLVLGIYPLRYMPRTYINGHRKSSR